MMIVQCQYQYIYCIVKSVSNTLNAQHFGDTKNVFRVCQKLAMLTSGSRTSSESELHNVLSGQPSQLQLSYDGQLFENC